MHADGSDVMTSDGGKIGLGLQLQGKSQRESS